MRLALALTLVLAAPLFAAESKTAQLEQVMFGLVNADREANGSPRLGWDEGLRDVARGHSLDMATHGFFAHESPTTGAPADRIFKAGIPAMATGENIAKDFDIGSAEEMLMKSPGHRANILSQDYDRIGIGVVEAGGYLYITQNFRKAIQLVEPKREMQALFDRMNKERADAGAPPLFASRALMEIARDVAKRQNTQQKLLSNLPALLFQKRGITFRAFWAFVGLEHGWDRALEMKELKNPEINRVGLYIVPNATQDKGLGMLWLCVLLANIP